MSRFDGDKRHGQDTGDCRRYKKWWERKKCESKEV
jgi:hypothetical protein